MDINTQMPNAPGGGGQMMGTPMIGGGGLPGAGSVGPIGTAISAPNPAYGIAANASSLPEALGGTQGLASPTLAQNQANTYSGGPSIASNYGR